MEDWTSITAGLAWRLVKLVAVAAMAAGVFGAIAAPSRRTRLVMTYGYAVPGFVLSWGAGWMLMKMRGQAPTEPWIVAAILCSGVALHLTFLVSHRVRPRMVTSLLAGAAWMAAITVMVMRAEGIGLLLGLVAVGGLLGAAFALPFALSFRRGLATSPAVEGPGDDAVVWRGFQWIAWVEGASFLVMLLVSMPLKHGFGVQLDGGTALIGWLHGVLLIVYVQALSSATRTFGWTAKDWVIGFIAALLPAGSFFFERRMANAARGESGR
jgi:integral membrane protein